MTPSSPSRRYGVPYQGSKNTIASPIVSLLPSGSVFVDLFAGGCAITHAAIEQGRWGAYVVNDIDWRGVTLFRDAVSGRYRNERRVISRSEFHRQREKDAFISLIWSFGNNGRDYLWNEETEGLKRRACEVVMSSNVRERRRLYMDFARYVQTHSEETGRGRLYELEPLARLESLQSLEGIVPLDELRVVSGDYREVDIPKGAVVYCDPPYRDTGEYKFNGIAFDHSDFDQWLRTRPFPVFVSEYSMPDDFVEVWATGKNNTFNKTLTKRVTERLFVYERWRNVPLNV